jgi:hypothetical protein
MMIVGHVRWPLRRLKGTTLNPASRIFGVVFAVLALLA